MGCIIFEKNTFCVGRDFVDAVSPPGDALARGTMRTKAGRVYQWRSTLPAVDAERILRGLPVRKRANAIAEFTTEEGRS